MDVEETTAKERLRIDEIIGRLAGNEDIGKPLHHMEDVFSIRIENKRLIYNKNTKDGKITILFFKSREDVTVTQPLFKIAGRRNSYGIR